MVMAEIQQVNNVRKIAEEGGKSYAWFVGRCIAKGLSVDTAKALWDNEERQRGYFKTTKNIVADILKRPIEDIFGEQGR
jgi:hypothetical protein